MSDLRAEEALNQLLRSAHDSAAGFRQGASLARNPSFQALFREREQERGALIQTIEAQLRSFGAQPVEIGTFVGEAHQLFTRARDAIDGGSDKGLLREIARREGLVSRSFDAMAHDSAAPEPARRIAVAALDHLITQRRELEGLSESFTCGSDALAAQPETIDSNNGRLPMAAHFKLSEDDQTFLALPNGASVLFAGSNGTQTWIERAQDGVVRIGIQSVAIATAEGGSLAVSIEVGDQTAQGEDGPAPIEHHLNASQSVQLLVKAGERIAFRAFPAGRGAQVLRTMVWASDLGGPKA